MTEDNKKVKRANSKNIMTKLKDHFYEYAKLVSSKGGKSEAYDEVWEEFQEGLRKDIKYFTKSVVRPFKNAKDKNAPVKRRSAYIFYCMAERDNVKKKYPEYKVTDISVELGFRWKQLSDEEKKPFQEKSEADKKRYEKEMSKYKHTKVAKKRGSSGFNMFCYEKRDDVKEKNEDKSSKEVTKMLSSMWKKLSDKDKQKYKKLAEEKNKKSEDSDAEDADDENDTKKPLTGYNLYVNENKPVFKKENPKMKTKDLAEFVAKKWNALSEKDKKEYNMKALKMKKEQVKNE